MIAGHIDKDIVTSSVRSYINRFARLQRVSATRVKHSN